MDASRKTGAVLLALIVIGAAGAPVLTPHSPSQHFDDYGNAPPMRPRIIDADGNLRRPFVYPLRLVDRLERRYADDRLRPVRIDWFVNGAIASINEADGPWLPLGADSLGRDVLSRLLYGSRLSLGVSLTASIGALAIGLLVGGAAGFSGGRLDRLLMAAADFVLVLPAIYLVLAIRATLPLVLSAGEVFAVLTGLLTVVAWPVTARGVRAIVTAERAKEYAEAAKAVGAGPLRILLRHLLPATAAFLISIWTMLVPAFVLTEATLSFVGLGFPVPTATWGAMLRDAWQAGALLSAPWLMAPAGAIVLTVLALHLLTTASHVEGPHAGTFS
jgi:peptide/nickel transport system permease protein